MLDGLHVDFSRDAVLSAPARRQVGLQQGILHLRAELEQHGRVHDDSPHPGARTEPHNHSVHVHVHLHHVQEAEDGVRLPRQGVRDGAFREPLESEPSDVLRARAGVFPVVGALRRAIDVRKRYRCVFQLK